MGIFNSKLYSSHAAAPSNRRVAEYNSNATISDPSTTCPICLELLSDEKNIVVCLHSLNSTGKYTHGLHLSCSNFLLKHVFSDYITCPICRKYIKFDFPTGRWTLVKSYCIVTVTSLMPPIIAGMFAGMPKGFFSEQIRAMVCVLYLQPLVVLSAVSGLIVGTSGVKHILKYVKRSRVVQNIALGTGMLCGILFGIFLPSKLLNIISRPRSAENMNWRNTLIDWSFLISSLLSSFALSKLFREIPNSKHRRNVSQLSTLMSRVGIYYGPLLGALLVK